MFVLYILAIVIHTAFAVTPCKDGVKIVTKETKNPADIIGNWTYVYHWDNLNKFKWDFDKIKQPHDMQCPEITIEAIHPDYVSAKQAECKDSYAPFDWADAKLKLDAPLMKMKGGILFMGEKENWLMMECKRMVKVVVNKVSDDYIVMINPDVAHISEMMARKVPSMEELKCIVKNVDVCKDMSGFGLCY